MSKRNQNRQAPPQMSYEKAVRCLPSFLMPLTHGRPTLLDLQAGVILYGARELGLKFDSIEDEARQVDVAFMVANEIKAKQLLNWLELTRAITIQKR